MLITLFDRQTKQILELHCALFHQNEEDDDESRTTFCKFNPSTNTLEFHVYTGYQITTYYYPADRYVIAGIEHL